MLQKVGVVILQTAVLLLQLADVVEETRQLILEKVGAEGMLLLLLLLLLRQLLHPRSCHLMGAVAAPQWWRRRSGRRALLRRRRRCLRRLRLLHDWRGCGSEGGVQTSRIWAWI